MEHRNEDKGFCRLLVFRFPSSALEGGKLEGGTWLSNSIERLCFQLPSSEGERRKDEHKLNISITHCALGSQIPQQKGGKESVERTGLGWKRSFWSQKGYVKGVTTVRVVSKPDNEC